ncbi:MAG: hypothetical protein CVU21_01770 [Betaproteobacteria bacterium HGW-Betaproteobacteria-15]|nr:MAG: hypothetical protein CVU21_01770 [Betaproteobacteria bacterium HGW-Betaproteobacteria-15]
MPFRSTGKYLHQKVNFLLETHCCRDKVLVFLFTHSEKQSQFFSQPLLNLLESDHCVTNGSKQRVGLIDQIAFSHKGKRLR